MAKLWMLLSVVVQVFVSFPSRVFGQGVQSVTASISTTSLDRGGFVDVTLVSYATGNVHIPQPSGVSGGYHKTGPGTNKFVPLVNYNFATQSLHVRGDIATASEAAPFRGRVSTPSARVMRLSGMTFGDQRLEIYFRMVFSGGWWFVADKTESSINSQAFRVTVTAPPKSTAPLLKKTLYSAEADTMTLTCSFEGFPTVRIAWTDPSRKGVISSQLDTVPPHSSPGPVISKRSITIETIRINESGIYLCMAANDRGHTAQSTEVRVYYKPIVTSFSPDNAILSEGATVQFTCNATGNANISTYYYFFNGVHIVTSSSNRWSRQLANCKTSSGMYSCIAGNSIANSSTVGYNFTIGGFPIPYLSATNITANESDSNMTLSCYGVGCPSPSVSWRKVGDPSFQSSGNLLVFSSVVRANAGTYKCTVTNQHGSANNNAVVTVNYPPIVVTQVSTIKACIGEEISIPCKADAVPMPTVNISNSIGTVVSISVQGSVLYNVSITNTHFGEYTCYATNMFGTDRISITIARRDIAGAPLDVTVTADGANALTVTWKSPVCIPSSLIASYIIFVVHPTTGDEFNFTASCSSKSLCNKTILDLEGNVNYEVSMVAVDGNGQNGERSNPQPALTKAGNTRKRGAKKDCSAYDYPDHSDMKRRILKGVAQFPEVREVKDNNAYDDIVNTNRNDPDSQAYSSLEVCHIDVCHDNVVVCPVIPRFPGITTKSRQAILFPFIHGRSARTIIRFRWSCGTIRRSCETIMEAAVVSASSPIRQHLQPAHKKQRSSFLSQRATIYTATASIHLYSICRVWYILFPNNQRQYNSVFY